MHRMEIIRDDSPGAPRLRLQAADGCVSMQLAFGESELINLDARLAGRRSERPQTHDLLVACIEGLAGTLQDVVIVARAVGPLRAFLRIRSGSSLRAVPAPLVDALTTAVACRPAVPIYLTGEE